MSMNSFGVYCSQYRGVAFYKVWEVIHGANPGDAGYQSVPIPSEPTTTGTSTSVPWADRWALEDRNARTIIESNVMDWQSPDKYLETLNEMIARFGSSEELEGYKRHVEEVIAKRNQEATVAAGKEAEK